MRTDWFSNSRFGMFIHWGIYSIPGRGEWTLFYDDWNTSEYEKLVNQFNPIGFDPSSWAEIAWNSGMRYVVFTTKHHDGFCMYDSDDTDFKITNTPYGKDITREIINAFRTRGLKIGFYHSLVDWHHPHYIPDAEHPLWKKGERDFSKRDLKIYQKYLYDSVEQLMSDYGKVDILFFDYTSKYKKPSEWRTDRLLEMIYSLQPDIMVNDRLSHEKVPVFYGDYCTPEISLPNQEPVINGKKIPWETCMTLNENWGYNATDKAFKLPNTIIRSLVHCASMNGNLLLNIGPDAMGKIPLETISILIEVGKWMNKYNKTIYKTRASEYPPPVGCYYTSPDKKTLYLHLVNPLMGDLILPELNNRVKRIKVMADSTEVPMINSWGNELLKKSELRIRPPKYLARHYIDVLEIKLF